MKNAPGTSANEWILYGITAAVLVGILVIGLWPLRFHPANNVNWILTRDGIRLGANGSVVSSGPFHAPVNGVEAAGPCSLELWIAPAFSSAATSILAVSTPSNPV